MEFSPAAANPSVVVTALTAAEVAPLAPANGDVYRLGCAASR